MANPVSKNKEMLSTLKVRLSEGEMKRKKELAALKELTRAIMQITERNENLPVMRDLVIADTVAPCKAETAEEALQLLKDGNARFVKYGAKALLNKEDKKSAHPLELHLGQRPHAVLVTCSDSRVPPELVFGQGLGDLFVVRIAGNAVDTLARASIIYAIQHLGAPLVVVMGHESCGAVQASLLPDDKLKGEASDIKQLVQNIREGLKSINPSSTDDEKLLSGVVCNVHRTVQALKAHPDMANLAATKKVMIVGAYYSFNGVCTFFGEGANKTQQPKEEKRTPSSRPLASPWITNAGGRSSTPSNGGHTHQPAAKSSVASRTSSKPDRQVEVAQAGAVEANDSVPASGSPIKATTTTTSTRMPAASKVSDKASSTLCQFLTNAANITNQSGPFLGQATVMQVARTGATTNGSWTFEDFIFSPTSIWFFIRVVLLIGFLRCFPFLTNKDITPSSMLLWGIFDLVVVTVIDHYYRKKHAALMASLSGQ